MRMDNQREARKRGHMDVKLGPISRRKLLSFWIEAIDDDALFHQRISMQIWIQDLSRLLDRTWRQWRRDDAENRVQ